MRYDTQKRTKSVMYVNKYDKHGECSKNGNHAEHSFVEILKYKNCFDRKATQQEQFDHIDYFAKKNGYGISFDVKARKKKARNDSDVDDDLVWVEFKNGSGDKGWLYGKATCIAFERERDFVIVERSLLLNFCKNKVENKKVSSSKDAIYKLYTRNGRNDLLSIVKMEDVMREIRFFIWQKNHPQVMQNLRVEHETGSRTQKRTCKKVSFFAPHGKRILQIIPMLESIGQI